MLYEVITIIMSVLEAQLGVPFVDLSTVTIPQEMIKLVPVNIAKKHKLIPLKVENELLYRITSYNVCYTKLLRDFHAIQWP